VQRHLGIGKGHPLVLVDRLPRATRVPSQETAQPTSATAPADSALKGSTAPDYSVEHAGFTEWVNQRADRIHLHPTLTGTALAGLKAACRCRARAEKEAANLPEGDRYSLDFIRDPGEPTRTAMLEILFRDDSPVYRVKFGEDWFERPGVPSPS
jgi:hypothetical protein